MQLEERYLTELEIILDIEENELMDANEALGFQKARRILLPHLKKAAETIKLLGERHPDCMCMDREGIAKAFFDNTVG